MLQGVLGLLTGWALLIPAVLVLYLRLGGPFHPWMTPFIGIAVSVPMLGFLTLGGIAVIALSVRQLSRNSDQLRPTTARPRGGPADTAP